MNYQDRANVLRSGKFRCSLCEFPYTLFVWHCQDIQADLVAPGVPLTFLTIQNSVHHADAGAERALFRKLNEYLILVDTFLHGCIKDHVPREVTDPNYPWLIVSPKEHIDLPAFCELAVRAHLDHWNPWLISAGTSASMAKMNAFFRDHLSAFRHLICMLKAAEWIMPNAPETLVSKSLREVEQAIMKGFSDENAADDTKCPCDTDSHPLPDIYLASVVHTTNEGAKKCIFSVELANFTLPLPPRVIHAALPKNVPSIVWKAFAEQNPAGMFQGSRLYHFEATQVKKPTRNQITSGHGSLPLHPYLSLALMGTLDLGDQREAEIRLSRIRHGNAKIEKDTCPGSCCCCCGEKQGDVLLWMPCLDMICQKCSDAGEACTQCNFKWKAEGGEKDGPVADQEDLALLAELAVDGDRMIRWRIQSTPWESSKEMTSLMQIHTIVSSIRANALGLLEPGKLHRFPPLTCMKKAEACIKRYLGAINDISHDKQRGCTPCGRLEDFAKMLARAAGATPRFPQPPEGSHELDLSDFLERDSPGSAKEEEGEEEDGEEQPGMDEIKEMIFSPRREESLDYLSITFDLQTQMRCLTLYVTGREVSREYLPDLPPPQYIQAYRRKGFTHIAFLLWPKEIYSFRLETCIAAKSLPKSWKEMEGHATFDPAFWIPEHKSELITRPFQIAESGANSFAVFTNAGRMAVVCKASDLHEAMVNNFSRTSISRTFNPARDIPSAELTLGQTPGGGEFSSYPQFGVLGDSQFAVFLDEGAIQTVSMYPISWVKGLPSFSKPPLQIKVEGGPRMNKIFLPSGSNWAVLSAGSIFKYPSNTITELHHAGRDVTNITPVFNDGSVIISTGQPRDPFQKIEIC